MTTIKVDRSAPTVTVTRGDPVVTVTRDGLPGPRGATGEQGPPGPPGGGIAVTYVHVQGVSAVEWVIEHNLDRYPSVTIVDSAGTVVVAKLQYIDTNRLIVSLDYPFSGKAYLN